MRQQPRLAERRNWYWLASALMIVTVLGVLGLWRPWGLTNTDSPEVVAAPRAEEKTPVFGDVRPFFEHYCYDCHSGEEAEGGFQLNQIGDTAGVLASRRRWERVFQLVKVGNMPPADVEQPADSERQRVLDWLDRTLFYVDCTQRQDPGRVTIRRLNKTEYNLTIRDLVGVNFDPAAGFPSDDVGYGFDNIGDVLTVPPLLIEQYLSAAEEIADRAIQTRDPGYFDETFGPQEMRTEGSAKAEGKTVVVMPSRGTVTKRFTFPRTGEYIFTVEAAANQHGPELAKMELAIDGKPQHQFEVHGDHERAQYELRLKVGPERKPVSVTFINDFYEENKGDRNLYVYSIGARGPLDPATDVPKSHRQLIAHMPSPEQSATDAARLNLQTLLRRAFRRPVTEAEVKPYLGFVEQALARGESFERAMQIGLQAVLVSPQFLFRVETPGGENWNGQSEPISDLELASRLSYFLWSSMPDDELLQLAEQGRLHEADTLRAQTDRLLRDPKADSLIVNFAGQWLGLRKLATNEVSPDPEVFPQFNDQLRRDTWKESELFLGAIVREDRPITDLINGRYSFLNERLAKLYGVEGIRGDEFRRYEFTDDRRFGVLTQASILTLSSYPNRTSPVKRGEWVLSNLLGDKPPDPPPVVPALDETQNSHPDLSLRQQLELHRADPTCASCHQVMDEIGFGLENFDAIGRWRTKEGKHPIDAVGVLPSGERFNGPRELVQVLGQRQDDVARCVAEKLLTYALGRGLEYYDRCAVEGIVRELQAKEYRFSALVHGIVSSDPFLRRRAK
ncbi:MAG: DUF1592 domain-containing protein [Planctomycetaceae bacterium]